MRYEKELHGDNQCCEMSNILISHFDIVKNKIHSLQFVKNKK